MPAWLSDTGGKFIQVEQRDTGGIILGKLTAGLGNKHSRNIFYSNITFNRASVGKYSTNLMKYIYIFQHTLVPVRKQTRGNTF
jgi:hypothetical protein